MAVAGGFSSTILNGVFVIQQETVGLGPNIVCIKNNGGVSGPTITGDTYYLIQGTGDTGGALGTSIVTSQIKAIASTISATEFGSNLEFWTHPDDINVVSTKQMEIDKDGQVIVTGNADTANFTSLEVIVGNIIARNGAVSSASKSTDADGGAFFSNIRNRNGGAIQSGDLLGKYSFEFNDGTENRVAAQIRSTSSGTIALNRAAADL